MKMYKLLCDLCGLEINDSKCIVSLETNEFNHSYELCEKCFDRYYKLSDELKKENK